MSYKEDYEEESRTSAVELSNMPHQRQRDEEGYLDEEVDLDEFINAGTRYKNRSVLFRYRYAIGVIIFWALFCMAAVYVFCKRMQGREEKLEKHYRDYYLDNSSAGVQRDSNVRVRE